MMKIKIMKKFYLVLLFLGMFVGVLSSCSDDDDKYIPVPPIINIVSGNLSMQIGDSIVLKAAVASPTATTFSWMIDSTEVSTDSIMCLNPSIADFLM